jgi:hypothetical protein
MVKWPLEKRSAVVARGGEAEQTVGPVVNAQNALFQKCTHGLVQRGGLDTQNSWRL